MAEAMGFNDVLPFDVRNVPSIYPDIDDDNEPFRAFAAIGQGDVDATPLQMALVAATVANDGEVPGPGSVKEVVDRSGSTVERFRPETTNEAMSSETAARVDGDDGRGRRERNRNGRPDRRRRGGRQDRNRRRRAAKARTPTRGSSASPRPTTRRSRSQ